MVGTDADLAKRAASRDVLTAAAYSGSLPQAQQYASVKEAADKALELAKVRAAQLSNPTSWVIKAVQNLTVLVQLLQHIGLVKACDQSLQ